MRAVTDKDDIDRTPPPVDADDARPSPWAVDAPTISLSTTSLSSPSITTSVTPPLRTRPAPGIPAPPSAPDDVPPPLDLPDLAPPLPRSAPRSPAPPPGPLPDTARETDLPAPDRSDAPDGAEDGSRPDEGAGDDGAGDDDAAVRRRGARVRADGLDRIGWVLSVVQMIGLAVFVGLVALRPLVGPTSDLDLLVSVVVLGCTVALTVRAAVREADRRLLLSCWVLLALAHLLTLLSAPRGDRILAYGMLRGHHPTPGILAPTGPLAMIYFPLTLAALWLLLREGVPRWLPGMWADAVVVGLGALAAGTFTATLLPQDVTPRIVATGDGYPMSMIDICLIAVILSAAALPGARLGAAAWWVAAGLILEAGTDLLQVMLWHVGLYRPGHGPDIGWLAGFAAIGWGARRSPWSPWTSSWREGRPRSRASLHLGVVPWALTGVSAAILALTAIGMTVPRCSAVLALGCLCAALLRVGLALAELDAGPLPAGAGRTDELTGLANRRALSEALAGDGTSATDQDGRRWSGWTDRIALLLVDLHSFKDINEALGHEVGDRVLAAVGARLRAALRSPQLVARLGGDEFAVVLPGAGSHTAVTVAESLAAVVAEPVEIGGHRLHVSASIGVATCVTPRDQPGDLLRRADVALNRAKALGVGLQVYDRARDQRTAQRLQRIDELRSALERGDLEVFLQPQVDLVDGTVVGAEALARWRHPQDGVLLPDSFLPLAAATGLMRPVAALVLDRAVEACAQWWCQGHHVPVSVNLTADDLRDPQLTRRITGCLSRHALPPQALRIELTEDLLLTDPQAAAQLMRDWHRTGIAVAVDDFGTGYSSLGYLRQLPFDEVKLDRSFVADLHHRTTATIVRHTVAMAHGLGMRVVAEGVEDQATARHLADVGCDLGQGLYFGAPAALPDFLDRLPLRRARG